MRSEVLLFAAFVAAVGLATETVELAVLAVGIVVGGWVAAVSEGPVES